MSIGDHHAGHTQEADMSVANIDEGHGHDDGAVILSADEYEAFFERQCRAMVGMSAAEFRQRFRSGEWDDVIDDGDHGDLLYLAAMSGVAR
jgi:hypothetical protein